VTVPFATGRVVLLRHAWAGDRDEYEGDDRERPLDAHGRRQAEALPAHLTAHGVIAGAGPGGPDERPAGAAEQPAVAAPVLVSSPLVRCRDTLEPLAAAVGTTVLLDEDLAEVDPPLRSEDGWPDAAWFGARAVRAVDRAALAASSGATVIVCSHGEVLPALLATIAARSDHDVPTAIDLTAKALAKGAAWVLDPSRAPDWVAEIAAPDV
jgi:8-oxo-(d)GTP phosphatase